MLQRTWVAIPIVVTVGLNTIIIPSIKEQSSKQVYACLCLILAIWGISYMFFGPSNKEN